jgi:hypothetical protein
MSDGTVTLLEKIAAWEARIVSLDAFVDRLQSMLLALTKESLRRDKLVHERIAALETLDPRRTQPAQEPKQEREPGWYWTKNPDGEFLLRYWDGRWWGVTENMTDHNTLAAYLPVWVGPRIEVLKA